MSPEPLSERELAGAAQRLLGHLVASPVIGDLCLPGHEVPLDLRLKAELLQPGGSLWFRGAQHWLSRQLGRLKGLVCRGSAVELVVWARAARDHRLPVVAVLPARAPAELRDTLRALGCAVEDPVASGTARALDTGFCAAPGPEDADFALGVATVALELAGELPSSTERLVVAPSELTAAVAAGVAGLGLGWAVVPGPTEHPDAAALAVALRHQHRLCTREAGAAALAAAIAANVEGTCVLLGV